jgi:hypothetical protein
MQFGRMGHCVIVMLHIEVAGSGGPAVAGAASMMKAITSVAALRAEVLIMT